MQKKIVENLLMMSDNHLDASVKPMIKAWSDHATALQLLEVLDRCVHGSLASGFVIQTLNVLFEMACNAEGLVKEDVMASAPWRKSNQ